MNKAKGIKKKILIVGFFIYTIFLVRGIYWYFYLNGINTQVIISTQYSPIPSSIEVYIDDQLYYKNDSLQVLYDFTDGLHLSCGFHHLKVVVDGIEELAESFIVFPVRWIYIEVQKYDEDYRHNENWFSVEYSSTPIRLM